MKEWALKINTGDRDHFVGSLLNHSYVLGLGLELGKLRAWERFGVGVGGIEGWGH